MQDLQSMKEYFNGLPIANHMFLRCEEIRLGSARMTMEPPDELRNPDGAISGQLLASLADLAGGVAAASQLREREYAATIDLSLHFMRAAREVPLLAEAEVLRRGRSHCWLHVRIRDAAGVECVTATGTWAVYPLAGDLPDPLELVRSVAQTAE